MDLQLLQVKVNKHLRLFFKSKKKLVAPAYTWYNDDDVTNSTGTTLTIQYEL